MIFSQFVVLLVGIIYFLAALMIGFTLFLILSLIGNIIFIIIITLIKKYLPIFLNKIINNEENICSSPVKIINRIIFVIKILMAAWAYTIFSGNVALYLMGMERIKISIISIIVIIIQFLLLFIFKAYKKNVSMWLNILLLIEPYVFTLIIIYSK